MTHQYKGFIITKDGSKEMPWNIFKDNFCNWISCSKTLKECKASIDEMLKY